MQALVNCLSLVLFVAFSVFILTIAVDCVAALLEYLKRRRRK